MSIEKPDPVGPGCGWAFLGERPPVVDGAKLQSQGYLAALAAQKDLATQVTAWAQARREYNVAHARYVWDLTLYRAYQSYAAAVARARDYQAEQERKRQETEAAAAGRATPPARPRLALLSGAAHDARSGQRGRCRRHGHAVPAADRYLAHADDASPHAERCCDPVQHALTSGPRRPCARFTVTPAAPHSPVGGCQPP